MLRLRLPTCRMNELHSCWRSGRLRMKRLLSTQRWARMAMEEDYQKALELIFAYGYGCVVFKHNIYGDQSKFLDNMLDSSSRLPPEFFMNPKCPLAPTPNEATTIEAEQSKSTEKAKEPERSALAEDFAGMP